MASFLNSNFQICKQSTDHVLFVDTDYSLQMDDNDELDTIVMEDEDEAEVKEEDEEQELIIIPFKETCSKHIRGFRRHSCLYKYRLICAWQQDSRQTCTCANLYEWLVKELDIMYICTV